MKAWEYRSYADAATLSRGGYYNRLRHGCSRATDAATLSRGGYYNNGDPAAAPFGDAATL